MKNKLSAVISCFLIISIIIGAVPASAENAAADEVQALIDGIVAYNESASDSHNLQEWLDGELTEGAGTTSEWYVVALRQYEEDLDFTSFADALESFLANNEISGAATRQRYALALIACGRETNAFVSATANNSIGEQGVMSWVFGLHMLNNGVKSSRYTACDIVEKLLSLRLSDGGWALTGEYSDVDVTAMTVQALAPYYSANSEVKCAVDLALDLLGTKQLDDGSYQSFGTKNPESCAQVIVALSSVGIDAAKDTRFIKNGKTLLDGMLIFRLSDGSFCHTEDGISNTTATTQALCALVSVLRAQSGLSPLYVFDAGKVPISDIEDEAKPHETSGAEITAQTTTTASAATAASEYEAPPPSSATTDEGFAATEETSYKVWACLVVLAAMLIACFILWLCKKRHFKNFIFVTVIGTLAVCVILFTDFSTTEDYYHPHETAKSGVAGTVTLTIRCDTAVGKSDSEYIPSDGVILPVTPFDIADGDSVYDILVEAARKYNIQIENKGSVTGARAAIYITGINYLYEFGFGDLSGWVYHVNGVIPSVGCDEYRLSDGDAIEWLYTCELGNDVK